MAALSELQLFVRVGFASIMKFSTRGVRKQLGLKFKVSSTTYPDAQQGKFSFRVNYGNDVLYLGGGGGSFPPYRWAGFVDVDVDAYPYYNRSFNHSLIVRLYRHGDFSSPPPLEGSNFNVIFEMIAVADKFIMPPPICSPLNPTICDHGEGSWGNDPDSSSVVGLVTANFVVGSVIGAGGHTCTTPAIPPQVMAPVRVHQFNGGVGTTAGGHNFLLQFEGCGNLNKKIRYRIKAHGDSPGQGLLPLISPSTAKGVAVLVRRSLHQSFNNFESVNIGQWTTLDNNQSSYFIPLQVRYYRTGTVLAGTVHAAMTIETEYQ